MNFFNRELSWLQFNTRVLNIALAPETPLLERIKFLAIIDNNLDEFFMIRVAGIKRIISNNAVYDDPAGCSAEAIMAEISEYAHTALAVQQDLLIETRKLLVEEGIIITDSSEWSERDKNFLLNYFNTTVLPQLDIYQYAPSDSASLVQHAFPGIRSYYWVMRTKDNLTGQENIVSTKVTRTLKRFIVLPSLAGQNDVRFARLDQLLAHCAQALAPTAQILESLYCRVNRDADITANDKAELDALSSVRLSLKHRQLSSVVRLCTSDTSMVLQDYLLKLFKLGQDNLYTATDMLDMASLTEICSHKVTQHARFQSLRYTHCEPLSCPLLPHRDLFKTLHAQDILCHTPYEDYSIVLEFLAKVALDPAVTEIKITLYRTSGKSPIVESLMRAVQRGKKVFVLIELRARFDEEKNIEWAARLANAGATVVFGSHYKVHAKVALITRNEGDKIQHYVHFSTGNYNDLTARVYTDFSLLTTDHSLCSEVQLFFKLIEGRQAQAKFHHLVLAPYHLKKKLLELIERERKNARKGKEACIMAKMNSLADPVVIEALYQASQDGVKIFLNIRGVCMLIPGRKGLSENITVVSIVGRYLEHGRIAYFWNDGSVELYLSSADWMTRNLEHRLEFFIPVKSLNLKKRLFNILCAYFRDNQSASYLGENGKWQKREPKPGEDKFAVQDYFYKLIASRHKDTQNTDYN